MENKNPSFPYVHHALDVMLHNLDVGNDENDSGEETDGYTSNLIYQELVEKLRIESSTENSGSLRNIRKRQITCALHRRSQKRTSIKDWNNTDSVPMRNVSLQESQQSSVTHENLFPRLHNRQAAQHLLHPFAKHNFMFKCRASPDPVRWGELAYAKPMMQFSLPLRRDDVLSMTMLTSSLCSFY
ncbi:unnamed protein product [Caenorhabditis nigoni]